MMQNMIGYLDPDYVRMLEDVSGLLGEVFQTGDAATMALSGTGSAGMEAGLSSLLEPGDTAIVCICGFFGERMVDMATRVGANVVALRSEWGKPFPPEMLSDALEENPDVKLVAIVHAETSTGVRQPLEEISRLAREHDALFMVDAVTSLGGNNLSFDEWDIDYSYSATQKCLGCPPGLSPVAVSQRALDLIRSRETPPTSWYLDLSLNANYWYSPRVYHHTSPVSMVLALREGLRIVLEEGLENRFARHERNAAALRAGLEALGMEVVPPEDARLAQVTPVWIPEGVDDAEVRARLLSEYNIEIGKGLGQFDGKVWRFGLMGESSRADYVLLALSALENILPTVGYEVAPGAAVSAASRALGADV
jgi:alanine-glyoxylate transaminase/serine-glyoxylate transaminase/serine-pyruvate transaminase